MTTTAPDVDDDSRLCSYCGKPGQMTHEHVIAEWVAEFLKQEGYNLPAERRLSGTERETSLDGSVMITSLDPTTKQGHVGTETTLSVCASCNGGWMNNLQTQAQPYLKPLMRGVWGYLTSEAREAIAVWACMTALNVARRHPTIESLDNDRRWLHDHRTAPETWHAFIAPVTGLDALERILTRAGVYDGEGRAHECSATTLILGRLLVHVVRSSPLIKLEPFAFGRSSNVLPVLPGIPPQVLASFGLDAPPVLNRDDVYKLAYRFINAIGSMVENRPAATVETTPIYPFGNPRRK